MYPSRTLMNLVGRFGEPREMMRREILDLTRDETLNVVGQINEIWKPLDSPLISITDTETRTAAKIFSKLFTDEH